MNQRLKQQPENKKLKKAVKTLEKKHLPRLEKYEAQEKTLAGRSSSPRPILMRLVFG